MLEMNDIDTVIMVLHDAMMMNQYILLAFAFNCNSFGERLKKKGLLVEKGSGAD